MTVLAKEINYSFIRIVWEHLDTLLSPTEEIGINPQGEEEVLRSRHYKMYLYETKLEVLPKG